MQKPGRTIIHYIFLKLKVNNAAMLNVFKILHLICLAIALLKLCDFLACCRIAKLQK